MRSFLEAQACNTAGTLIRFWTQVAGSGLRSKNSRCHYMQQQAFQKRSGCENIFVLLWKYFVV
jgi:hypothetical protein